MITDPVLSQELTSLQEEVSASHRQHPSPSTDPSTARVEAVAPAAEPQDATEVQGLQAELREFCNAITHFFEDAEKNVSQHPAASVIGALAVGVLIGRLLGRR